jgi:hypothetical protein
MTEEDTNKNHSEPTLRYRFNILPPIAYIFPQKRGKILKYRDEKEQVDRKLYEVRVKTKQGGHWVTSIYDLKDVSLALNGVIRSTKEEYLSHEVFEMSLKKEYKGNYTGVLLSYSRAQMYNFVKIQES